MTEVWVTAEWARTQAERLEADARRLRELADRLDNPGLLPDERAAEIDNHNRKGSL